MKETILLYNFDSAAIRNKIKFLCIQSGIHIRVVEKQQYDVPIGILACGKKEALAGFTGTKLNQFLNAMYKQKIPRVNLKAMLTEYNVNWDSVTLHDELAKEHEAMNGNSQK